MNDVLDEIAMDLECGTIDHFADPITQPAGAIGQIRIGRRQFPQCLLPPHAADEEAQGVGRQMLEAALGGIAGEIDSGNDQAGNDQDQEHVVQRRTGEEASGVIDRIRAHGS